MANTLFKLSSLVFLSSIPFLFTLHGDFVFDDSEAVLKNKDVSSDSWTNCFHNDFWGTNIKSNLSHKSYRPLTIQTFRLNYFLNSKQLSAFSFKITNLACHLLCTLLVWRTYKIIVNNQIKNTNFDISYISALIFAVHPVHVEAVSGIVGRADLLCGITYFLAFICYNKAINSKAFNTLFLFLTVTLSAMSMLCKENGITVLGFCLYYDIVCNISFKKNQTLHNLCNKSFIRRSCTIMLSIFLLLYGRWTVMGATKPVFKITDNPAAFADSIFTKIATHSYIYFLNSLLLIWPQWLCYDWSMGCIPLVQSILDIRIIFPILMFIYAISVIIAFCRKGNKSSTKRVFLLGVGLAVIPFVPAANIFYPVGFVIAERVLYISSAGYCLLIAVGLNKIILRSNQCKLGFIVYISLITIYGLRSWQRSYDWQSEYNLFISGMSVCPLNAKVHYNVAKVADAQNKTDWALASYKESIRLYPEYYQAMNNLANLLKNQKKFSEAEFYLRTAIKLKEDFPAAWMNLGIVLASTKRLQESENAYKAALRYRKSYPDCFYNLGNLYLEMNRTNYAIESWMQTVTLNKKHALAWTNLIALLDNTEQFDRALQVIPNALAELPDSPSINFAAANVYGKLEQFEQAEIHFLKAIKLFDSKVHAIHYANLEIEVSRLCALVVLPTGQGLDRLTGLLSIALATCLVYDVVLSFRIANESNIESVLYHRWKKYKAAEIMYRNALKIDPNFKSSMKNLVSLQKIIKE